MGTDHYLHSTFHFYGCYLWYCGETDQQRWRDHFHLNTLFGIPKESLLNKNEYFLPIYILTEVWQTLGWNSIIYLSALAGIDQELYDAAKVDGAGRFKQVIYITIPCLIPTIIIMLILKMGKIFNVDMRRLCCYIIRQSITLRCYQHLVYRKGLIDAQYSYSAAVGLFNNLVSFMLVTITNKISKKVSGNGQW